MGIDYEEVSEPIKKKRKTLQSSDEVFESTDDEVYNILDGDVDYTSYEVMGEAEATFDDEISS